MGSIDLLRSRLWTRPCMLLLGDRSGRGSDFDPIACELEKEVDHFAESEHRSSEYETQRSTDITQQSETRVCSHRLHDRVPHVRVKYLHDQPSLSQCTVATGMHNDNNHAISSYHYATCFFGHDVGQAPRNDSCCKIIFLVR